MSVQSSEIYHTTKDSPKIEDYNKSMWKFSAYVHDVLKVADKINAKNKKFATM